SYVPQAAREGDSGPTLWIEIGALESIGDGIRRARLPISSKPDFDRLYQVLTDSKFKSTLELCIFATAGRRTWRQVVLGNVGFATQAAVLSQKQLLFTDALNKQVIEAPFATTTPPKDAPAGPMNWSTVTGPQLAHVMRIDLKSTRL